MPTELMHYNADNKKLELYSAHDGSLLLEAYDVSFELGCRLEKSFRKAESIAVTYVKRELVGRLIRQLQREQV